VGEERGGRADGEHCGHVYRSYDLG
jgi:hypothetical protein